jgi:sulfhydrogenase subunit beta (sulfur reductase)
MNICSQGKTMDKFFLASYDLPLLLAAFRKEGDLHAPQADETGAVVFGPASAASRLILDYRRTRLPPKKYLLPFQETTVSYRSGRGYRLNLPAPEPLVLFGLHPCDLAAIAYLDRIFIGEHPDPNYRARRSRITLVGLSCVPDPYCSCHPADLANWPRGDLFLDSVPDGFLLAAFSATGRRLLKTIAAAISVHPHSDEPVAPACKAVTPVVEAIPASPLWDEFAKRCLGCGACSACCPTCYCFAVHEQGDIGGKRAHRYRTLDNCLFAIHGLVAGGHDFRPSRQERFQYRYRHKYIGFGQQAGEAGCVGCGRCAEFCPVDIDLRRISEGSTPC